MHTTLAILLSLLCSLSLASSLIRPAASLSLSHLCRNRKAELIHQLSQRDDDIDDEVFDEEAYKEIQKQRETRAKVISGLQGTTPSDTDDIAAKFVPAFVGMWAVGYTALAAIETSGEGLGDIGGYFGAGFAVVLLVALVAAAAYEVFKFDT